MLYAIDLLTRDLTEEADDHMNDEKIKVRVTESGQFLDVVVLNKRADRIEVVLGEGVHSVRCALTPTRNAQAYVGNAMGREIVYERPRAIGAGGHRPRQPGAAQFRPALNATR